ncbi:BgtA-21149 [Blumeria graminis f. sp. tritici]|uniref:BgtA-21149 n=2 Tax=Blumeria graminis f. sp. tritici TaxID=62690 RepID=A0A9X9LAI4_BLUGR|nr:hypothetical protein BGT96224_A21149 [Blumeria graminis f. sp. tritici 96224]VCU40852.1 BgtA-21149 [Blumeria graminis f. sp. tritici]
MPSLRASLPLRSSDFDNNTTREKVNIRPGRRTSERVRKSLGSWKSTLAQNYKALHQRSTRATQNKLFQGSSRSLMSNTLKELNPIKPITKDDSDTESDTSTHSRHSTSSDESEILVQEVDNSQDEDYIFDHSHDELYNSSDSKEFEIEDHDSINDSNDSEPSKNCDYSSSEELKGKKNTENNKSKKFSSISKNSQSKEKENVTYQSLKKMHTISSKKYFDSWAGFKLGYDNSREPLATIDSIFEHLTGEFVKNNLFTSMIEHLNGRSLRIATMCSGTECPVIALEFICESK